MVLLGVLFGIVKFFNFERNFGVVIGDDGEEFIFLYSGGQYLFEGKDGPVFLGKSKKFNEEENKWICLKKPKKGDRLVYEIEKDSNGEKKVSVWGYFEEFGKIIKLIVDRENKPLYRVFKLLNTYEEKELLWEGRFLEDLLEQIPISANSVTLQFEKMNGERIWKECGDPRPYCIGLVNRRNELYR